MVENETSGYSAFKRQTTKREKVGGSPKGWSEMPAEKMLSQKPTESKIHNANTTEREEEEGTEERHSVSG